jgi:hypothetical protein
MVYSLVQLKKTVYTSLMQTLSIYHPIIRSRSLRTLFRECILSLCVSVRRGRRERGTSRGQQEMPQFVLCSLMFHTAQNRTDRQEAAIMPLNCSDYADPVR